MMATKEEENVTGAKLDFAAQLAAQGWTNYFVSAMAVDVGSEEQGWTSLGFRDPLGKRQIIVTMPTEIWMAIFRQLAKKA